MSKQTDCSALGAEKDPTFAAIAAHRKAHTDFLDTEFPEKTEEFEALAQASEASVQALGTLQPTTLAGASALLEFMIEMEGQCCDPQSPFLRTVQTVARTLPTLAA